MGEKVRYVRFRFTGTLDDLNEIREEVEEVMKSHGWKRGFSEMAPLEANPEILRLQLDGNDLRTKVNACPDLYKSFDYSNV